MIKKYTVWAMLFSLACVTKVSAQAGLSASSTSLSFPSRTELQVDSQAITITNNADYAVAVTGIRFFSIWNAKVFSSKDTNFTLQPQASRQIFIRFAPNQNVTYNSEAVILNDSRRGALRINLAGIGAFSNSYYSTTFDLKEAALVARLKTIISTGYNTRGYNNARNDMYEIIDNKRVNGQGASSNTVECVYRGLEISGWANRTAAQNLGFNTEHTMPQSLFNSADPMVSDIHHLFPTEANVNGDRGNDPFGNIANNQVTTWYKNNTQQSAIPSDPQNWSKARSGLFEPRDVHKGRAARALLYFATRHQDYSNFIRNQETTLYAWHRSFPPNAVDRKRNADIHRSSSQNNRNPYVDYPQLLDRIASVANTAAVLPAVASVYISHTQADFGQVPANTATTFNVVIANTGNRDVTVSAIAVTPTTAFTYSGPLLQTLAVGEAIVIPISVTLPAGQAATGNLVFSTNVPSSGSITIPLSANTTVGLSNSFSLSFTEPSLFPQPAESVVYLNTASLAGKTIEWSLIGLDGKTLSQGTEAQAEELVSLTLPQNAGVYFLKIRSGNYAKTMRVQKQ